MGGTSPAQPSAAKVHEVVIGEEGGEVRDFVAKLVEETRPLLPPPSRGQSTGFTQIWDGKVRLRFLFKSVSPGARGQTPPHPLSCSKQGLESFGFFAEVKPPSPTSM